MDSCADKEFTDKFLPLIFKGKYRDAKKIIKDNRKKYENNIINYYLELVDNYKYESESHLSQWIPYYGIYRIEKDKKRQRATIVDEQRRGEDIVSYKYRIKLAKVWHGTTLGLGIGGLIIGSSYLF